jgi:hypothetical protein
MPNMVLTSEKKIKKLFIKFVIWNKFAKANNLLKQYPEYNMPWQKAFEEASSKNMYIACKWIYNHSKQHLINIDIHFNNNEILATPCKFGNLNDIKFIINLEPTYHWIDNIQEMVETSPMKKQIFELLSLYNINL